MRSEMSEFPGLARGRLGVCVTPEPRPHEIEDDRAPADRAGGIAENVERLRSLFPEAFAEETIDFAVLRQLLGGEVAESAEKYGLNWHGKRQARQLALKPSAGTLRPCSEESVDWDTTRNLMIEGDNLEVLKLLQKSYAGKVKLIYIDPPYNTGKDFVYPDDYHDSIRNYLKLTGQVDRENRKLSSNTEASGRFHTAWLNMMYPRLKIARNLMTNDGVILISIDDGELHNLRSMCDELFGEDGFCGAFIWEKKKKPSFLDRSMGTVTDYIVAYAKDRASAPAFTAGTVETGKKYPFNNAGNGLAVLTFPPESVRFGTPDRIVEAQDMSEGNIKTELLDAVQIRDGTNRNAFRLRGEWRYSQAKLDEFVAAGAEILISKVPFRPNYVNRSGEQKKTANLLSYRINAVPTNEDATQAAREIFGNDVVSYPKPEGLLQYLIRAVSHGDDLILDFFAGSGTTASALWRQNIADSCSRRFILVQLPEPISVRGQVHATAAKQLCERLGVPPNLAELTKEWLRRSGAKVRREAPLLTGDFGFRVFKLASSNIRSWSTDPDDLQRALVEQVDNLAEGRTGEDVLFELLLKLGLDLSVRIESRRVAGTTVRCVADGVLFACLERTLTRAQSREVAVAIASWREDLATAGSSTAVLCDCAFIDDAEKLNLAIVLEQAGVTNVKYV